MEEEEGKFSEENHSPIDAAGAEEKDKEQMMQSCCFTTPSEDFSDEPLPDDLNHPPPQVQNAAAGQKNQVDLVDGGVGSVPNADAGGYSYVDDRYYGG